ncbi:LuxR C-terminal-related transcriptional regulator, partial [Methylobacterium sp. A54F]
MDRRPLVGQCLLASLRDADAQMRFETFASLGQWHQDTSLASACLVLLCLPGGHAPEAERAEIQRELAELRGWNPSVPVAVMSDCESPEQIIKVLELGIKGYIPTTVSLQVAVHALQLVRAGGVYMPAASMFSLLSDINSRQTSKGRDDEVFSPRQLSVARALRKGTPNKIIAYELNMCESTVKVHVRNIMKKLKAKNRTEV